MNPNPENPDNPVAMMYDHLERFINQMLNADAHFSVFPHNLSEYESIDNLPDQSKTQTNYRMKSTSGLNTSPELDHRHMEDIPIHKSF